MSVALALVGVALIALALAMANGEGRTVKGWPEEIQEIRYRSEADGTMQPALFYCPPGDDPAPLLVGLHHWSFDHTTRENAPYGRWCVENGWCFVFPNFRGPNRRPEATGSDLAVKDILSAVSFARENAPVDPKRVYLSGASGGGHMALLMAGRAPEIWAGVTAWVPIVDLAAWHEETRAAGLRYADEIVASCGGPPGASEEVDREYRKRSPLTYLSKAQGVKIDINAGIHDGHRGSVPIGHALRGFNALAGEADRLSEEQIGVFVEQARVPEGLETDIDDPVYGDRRPLFRRASGEARITIFDGGHEIVYPAALDWLSRQAKP